VCATRVEQVDSVAMTEHVDQIPRVIDCRKGLVGPKPRYDHLRQ
jgi:hypothetical protein